MQEKNKKNKLKEFFDVIGVRQSSFARRAGIPESRLSYLLTGKMGVSIKVAEKILICCKEIKNEIPDVTFEDIVDLVDIVKSRNSTKKNNNAHCSQTNSDERKNTL